jgi:hypothetical protein
MASNNRTKETPSPRKDLRQARGIYPKYASPGEKALYKVACAQAEGRREKSGTHVRAVAIGKPAARQPDDIL